MALLFMDSFDHYATAQLGNKYVSIGGTPAITGTARNGTQGLFCDGDNTLRGVVAGNFTGHATFIAGVAFLVNADSTLNPNWPFLTFLDTATPHVDVRFNSSFQLYVTRNGTTIVSPSAGTTFTPGGWNYIELKATIADGAGVAVVTLNGVTIMNASGLDTRNGAAAQVTQVRLQGQNAANNSLINFDDFYVCDGSGAAPTNDLLGDVRVQAIFPNGNGNTTNFDGSDGNQVDNYLLVDEGTPNSDTDYVESPDVNDKDTYTYGNLTPTTGDVFGVQIMPFARKTDAGTRTIATVARLSATEEDSSNYALSTSYNYYRNVRETKPGGGAWSISDVNSAEFGQKVTA